MNAKPPEERAEKVFGDGKYADAPDGRYFVVGGQSLRKSSPELSHASERTAERAHVGAMGHTEVA